METTFTLFKQTSSYRVLSRNACLFFMRTNSIGSYYSRGISSAKVVPLSKFSNYCTHSKDDVCSSKRRSRGPVMAGKKAAEGIKQDEGKYKHTVDLPKTAFAMRANSSVREPEIQKIWEDNQVFKRVADKNSRIEVFGQMALKGYIYRGRKPVHWSPSSRTALAEAELEYPEGHVSKSIYAIFRVASAPVRPSDLLQEFPNLCLAIWATTPWTIPANAGN
ncbi:isoleucine--tRNA ligase, chloroplastic/mitochondrial-like isoform X3 [Trifolium pratense]|uniref:isoleucine--tRNA ligase, chloroplastic/mitochondrial-like isoform X3 n=1 Tax=Trifolium pratense TaxID=57577 RepID=UPI001E6911BA|nr:isoleucine--tRNA ligase, chloroplastic/mitochondrial-like isoform X3 [Trifolium pratense]